MSKEKQVSEESVEILNTEQLHIAEWLKKVKFKKAFFGVSERDVWKKIAELNDMYEKALMAERIRYETLLEKQRQEKSPDMKNQEVID